MSSKWAALDGVLLRAECHYERFIAMQSKCKATIGLGTTAHLDYDGWRDNLGRDSCAISLQSRRQA